MISSHHNREGLNIEIVASLRERMDFGSNVLVSQDALQNKLIT